jgi:hypothetical protein
VVVKGNKTGHCFFEGLHRLSKTVCGICSGMFKVTVFSPKAEQLSGDEGNWIRYMLPDRNEAPAKHSKGTDLSLATARKL